MTPIIKLIYLWAKLLARLGNTFMALGMSLSGRAGKVKDKIIERLQIRGEKLKRSGKRTVYRLLVSHDAGMTYQCELKNENLKVIVSRGKHLDTKMLRWYIMDDYGEYVNITCKIHGSIISAVDDGLGQRLITQMAKKDMEESK